MAAIWFSHIAAILMPYSGHVTKSYAYCMDTIWKTYGFAICLLYGIYIALNIRHMKKPDVCCVVCIWHLWLNYITALWVLYWKHMDSIFSCCRTPFRTLPASQDNYLM